VRILYIAGADSYHSYKWIKYFADKGNLIYWFTTKQPLEKWEHKNIKLYYIKGNMFSETMAIKSCLEYFKPDIIHAHYAGRNGLLGALVGFKPYIVTAWGSDILLAGHHFIKKWFIKYVLSKSTCITCDSEIMKSEINKMMPLRRVNIINFGVDVNKFKPYPMDRELVTLYGIEKSSTIVLSLRNYEPIYDVETLIRAADIVHKHTPKIKFMLAGHGSQELYFRRLVQDLHLFHTVKFIGYIPNDKISDYLNTADIYVSTALSDAGIAESTAEAMACEKPVIITDVAENNKWVHDKENGFLIPRKHPYSLADRILWLAKNKNIRDKLGVEARKIIVEKNNYKIEMDKMGKLYEGLMSEH
jgi:glycosyltransferase involved in cell wall biosynthesis